MKQRIRLTEGQLKRVIKESVRRILREDESKPTSLKKFMELWYDNDDSCLDALRRLTDESWLRKMGWKQVFHEGTGNGVYSPTEGIVAVFDEDDLPEYHSFQLYRYNPKAWKICGNVGWDSIYDGNNGGDVIVEPF